MTQHAPFIAQLPATFSTKDGVIYPQSHQDMQTVVQTANQTQTPLTVWPIQQGSYAQQIHFSGLNRVKRAVPEEFVITLESGMTVGEVETVLNQQNQRLPLRFSADKTLFSILAEEAISPTSTRYGLLRHWVLGLEAITGDGESIHYGGEILKNVTGYDLNKLFVGSQHQFGLITTVTLKVEPQLEATRTFLFCIETLHDALAFVETLLGTLINPEVISLIRTKSPFGWYIWLTVSGYHSVFQTQVEAVLKAASGLNPALQEMDLMPEVIEHWYRKLDWTHPADYGTQWVVKIALAQRQALYNFETIFDFPFVRTAECWLPLNTSTLFLRWSPSQAPTLTDLKTLQRQLLEWGGWLEILDSPTSHDDIARFNRDDNPVVNQLYERLKQQFDPNTILTPRFVSSVLTGEAR